jgi:hypothetical protein
MKQTISTNGEPLSPVAVITGLVSAGIILAVSFGLDLTTEQIGAINSFVALAAPVVVWLIGRNRTVPLDNVVALKNRNGDTVAAPASTEANGTPVVVLDAAA